VSVSAFALVHSPLVGPSAWRWVAQEFEAAGCRVAVPRVPPEVAAQGWAAFADAVAGQISGGEVLVGHSGAGPLLPQIAERAPRQPSALIFVDSAVPPKAGAAELMPDWLLADLRPLATDGVLPPWSDWFGPGVMQELVPDAEKGSAVCGELPRLPLAYFEDRVPVPTGWAERPSAYVLLSEPYATDADEAESRGWPVERRTGAHLDIVTRPAEIADAIVSVTTRLRGG
jgi:pimeloyl-ACP methyl ester carboxylesterase